MAAVVPGAPGLGMLTAGDRLEVWGDPIAHSRSPELHAAAYRVLGLDWSYGRRRVDEASFPRELSGLGDAFRGLSLTMPLKSAASTASRVRDRRAQLTGAVNTLVLTADGPLGFNTDVGGIVRDLRDHGLGDPDTARIVGAGATATSALVALAELGATHVEVAARRPAAAASLVALGESLGVDVAAVSLDEPAPTAVPLTIATLPGGIALDAGMAASLAASGGTLYDVVYGHWPTDLGRAWADAGGRAVHGLGMLVQQALLQVRAFVSADVDAPLPDETAVLAAMRTAVADA
jgi:shikimate dehydrogenase